LEDQDVEMKQAMEESMLQEAMEESMLAEAIRLSLNDFMQE
jgi:hypothetical protein